MSSNSSTTRSLTFAGALYRVAIDVMQKTVLKGTRWLLLKNPENLDAEKNESSG